MKSKFIHNLSCGVVLAACSVLALPVYAASAVCSALTAAPAVLELRKGMHQEFELPVAIRRLAVGNPEMVDVKLTSRNSFLVLGLSSGVTNLSVWTACAKEPRQSMLFIEGDAVTALTKVVNLPVDSPLPNQVQTDIRFVEVNRTKLKQMGVNIFGKGSNSSMFAPPGSSPSGLPLGEVSNSRGPLNLVDTGFNIIWGGGSSKVLGALNALEQSGFAYTLSKPSLVALSGQTASFLAGGEVPVPVPSSGSDSISIEYKPYGVRLNLTPTVIDRDRIHLKVAPEVSELDFNSGIEIQGTKVPALNVRRTDTSISLADGESFVISGLINVSNRSMVDKLPGLGSIPVLGALFRSTNIEREEKELLMIVTPRLVNPLAADANLPELPGEKLRDYDPNVFKMQLFESGNFDQRNGLSW